MGKLVIKRDGRYTAYDKSRITTALRKAILASDDKEYAQIAEKLSSDMETELAGRYPEGVYHVEDIQDLAERALMSHGLYAAAKAFIRYRAVHENVRNVKSAAEFCEQTIIGYTGEPDVTEFLDPGAEDIDSSAEKNWHVKQNASVSYSVGAMILNNSERISKAHWLGKFYDKEIVDAYKSGAIHIHDLGMLTGYCFTGDTRIKTLDGKNPTLKELAENPDDKFWVLAYDRQNNQIVPAQATAARKTRTVTKLAKIALTDGSVITSTTDHPFMTRDGNYVEAENLKPNMSLMPLYIGEKARFRSKDGRFVPFAYVASADPGKEAYNHCVRKVELVEVEPTDVYDITVPVYHNFALDCGVFVHNCAGWDLKKLIKEGLGGVKGKISSGPAKHLSTLCNQMVNFLGIMQNEWAGAQAFSSFDTYLAPFVKKDHLSYDQVKQCIQSFVFGVNIPSRWGCVDTETEVLSEEGFKRYDELKEGDRIFTWNDGKLELNTVNKVVTKPYKGFMHSYKGRGYHQFVTPTHRVLAKKNGESEYRIFHSEEIFASSAKFALPIMFNDTALKPADLTDAEIRMAAIVYTNGNFDMRQNSVHRVSIFQSPSFPEKLAEIRKLAEALNLKWTEKAVQGGFETAVAKLTFYGDSARKLAELTEEKTRIRKIFTKMDRRQSKLFLDTWMNCDGQPEKNLLQYDNEDIGDSLQLIALRAGETSVKVVRKHSTYIRRRNKSEAIWNYEKTEVPYDGVVWCPNVDNGTAVFRKDGCVFISGQTQAPFSNITLDWTCPDDLKNLPAVVGGEEQNFTYGDCEDEMRIVNKAFIEVMVEGDCDGRGFAYPIPTYSITRNFDWSDTENNRLLFEMAAKYGTPYFSNYVNSDMKPSDVRSMCPLSGSEHVLVRDDYSKEWHLSSIENLYKGNKKEKTYDVLLNGKSKKAGLHRFDGLEFLTVKTINGYEVTMSANHQNLVLRNGNTVVLPADQMTESDYLPFNTSVYEGGRGLTYEDGLMVGAFLGDGSLKDDYTVCYSLNNSSKNEFKTKIIEVAEDKFGAKISESAADSSGACVNVCITSRMLRGLIEEYVSGKALDKELNVKCLGRSTAFRSGILEGYQRTDGGNKSRIYTSSLKAVESVTVLLESLGMPVRVTKDDRKDVRFSERPNYCIRYYSPETNQDSYGDVYIKKDGYMWFKIDSIKKADTTGSVGYCFEVLNDEKPYFMLPSGLVTHNCRLRLDLRELRKQNGGNFGAGENTGSIGVVTINMPRIAYLASDEEDFFRRLEHMMDISARSLDIKRRVINKYMDMGLYPYTRRYLPQGFVNHFSTLGLVGMNEACLNADWIGEDLSHPKAAAWTAKVLDFMREKLKDYQEEYGNLFNLEATPAESTAYRLAKHDRMLYPDIITAGKKGETPYYTNSSHLPVGFTSDVFEALDIQDNLQTKYTSGTVFHCFLGEKLPDWKAAMQLVRAVAENYRLPYFTLSPVYSVCEEHGYLSGEQKVCPVCGKPTEVYSRITGYYRPVSNWNDGKLQEFEDRKSYEVTGRYAAGLSDTNEGGAGHAGPNGHEAQAAGHAALESVRPAGAAGEELLLFTTPSCPNCASLKQRHVISGYREVNAADPANRELVRKYRIMAAPTLIVRKPDGGTEKYANASEIMGFAAKESTTRG